jgi:hypothetical protein
MLPENKSTASLPGISLSLALALIGIFLICNYTTANAEPAYSKLWGKNGELWDQSENGRLLDFTTVGYKNGNVLIPDWAPSVDVTDFGAIPDDGIDDSQAFIDAIAACDNGTAVFVPKGRYTILHRIQPDRDHFVLKGEDMYETVLFFPRYLNEAELQEEGFVSGLDWRQQKTTGVEAGFIRFEGGTERSIENLTLEFREQMKGDHHEFTRASAIAFAGNISNSWVKNVVIRNADEGIMMDGATNLSVVNMIFDNYIGRPSILGTGSELGFDGHIGINLGKANYCLFHNIEFKGKYYHEFDIINVPGNNVISDITGNSRVNLHHHGQGAKYNLYTNVYSGSITNGIADLKDSRNQKYETHWGIYGDSIFDPDSVLDATNSNHVFVGYGADIDNIVTDTLWYENINPAQLYPKNIYLAQMELKNKPLPNYPLPTPPVQTSNVIRIQPTDMNNISRRDPNTVQNFTNPKTKNFLNEVFYKFDLGALNITDSDIDNIARVRLRITSRKFLRTPVTIGLWSVEDDAWTEETITYANHPAEVTELHTFTVSKDSSAEVFEFDVTSFVKSQFLGDKIASFTTAKISGDGVNSSMRTTQSGLGPQLIIEMVDSPVPGAPAPPSGLRTETRIGNILLDWEDNPEADVATYNIYRTKNSSKEIGVYEEPIATGLVTSDFRDISSRSAWNPGKMDSADIYFYRVTAVDSHGYESESSIEIVGSTLGKDDTNQSPAFTNSPIVLDPVLPSVAVSGSLVDQAADPEGDDLYFFKIDGPDWLTVNHDGTFSGTPSDSDIGLNRFTVQVTAFGGRDEAVVDVQVGSSGNPDTDNDGMNDFQEDALFGTLDGDGSGDIDGDGITDYFQYLYGEVSETYPGFSLTLTVDSEANPIITWVTQSDYQLGREYSLQFSSDLVNWATLVTGEDDQLTQTPITAHNKTIYELLLGEARGPRVFVRLIKP